MKPKRVFALKPPYSSLPLLTFLWFISGCSGSNNAGPGDVPPVSDDPITTEIDDIEPVVTSPVVPDPAPVVVSPAVPDPLIQNQVTVTFEITVPAYQSNELRVELDWGDINLNASWVGDEFWQASAEFPTNVENTLTVTFYDQFGDLILARYSQAFRTGSTATEALQISAEQFDAEPFDYDSDGVNNLAELLAGTDPMITNPSIPIVDTYGTYQDNRMSVSADFESQLTEDRPFSFFYEEQQDEYESLTIKIDIDSQGNGTLSNLHNYGISHRNLRGTRSHVGNTITWDTYRGAFDGDYHHGTGINEAVTYIDDNTRRLVREISGSNTGTYQFKWTASMDITARLIEGTSVCEPIYGSVSLTSSENNDGFSSTVTTLTKDIDDTYWLVTRTISEYIAGELVELDPDVFLAEKIVIDGQDNTPEGPYFICDYIDF